MKLALRSVRKYVESRLDLAVIVAIALYLD